MHEQNSSTKVHPRFITSILFKLKMFLASHFKAILNFFGWQKTKQIALRSASEPTTGRLSCCVINFRKSSSSSSSQSLLYVVQYIHFTCIKQKNNWKQQTLFLSNVPLHCQLAQSHIESLNTVLVQCFRIRIRKVVLHQILYFSLFLLSDSNGPEKVLVVLPICFLYIPRENKFPYATFDAIGYSENAYGSFCCVISMYSSDITLLDKARESCCCLFFKSQSTKRNICFEFSPLPCT